METEVWPHLIDECARRRIPCYLVNARLSERSASRYAKFGNFTRPIFAALTGVAAQTDADAQRLTDVGATRVTVTGNLKFDIDAPAAQRELGKQFRACFGNDRPVWVAASTRDGEETLILDALKNAADLPPNLLTVIVPRHPERFDLVAELAKTRGFNVARRSALAHDDVLPADVNLVIGDSMGELFAYYASADVAFVGGSLLPLGGQNLLEPIAVGTPVLIGVHTFNFTEIANAACDCGAARRVPSADELVAALVELLNHPDEQRQMRDNGHAFLEQHRGATERLMNAIEW
jgi:3-deoxy-D-manno-octulosonic-acid transferase